MFVCQEWQRCGMRSHKKRNILNENLRTWVTHLWTPKIQENQDIKIYAKFTNDKKNLGEPADNHLRLPLAHFFYKSANTRWLSVLPHFHFSAFCLIFCHSFILSVSSEIEDTRFLQRGRNIKVEAKSSTLRSYTCPISISILSTIPSLFCLLIQLRSSVNPPPCFNSDVEME